MFKIERSKKKMANVDSNMISNGLETINNLSKLAANVTTNKAPEKKTYKEDKMNQPHNQTVEVKVGNDPQPKPVIVHEKKETHIHKPFPEGRELSDRECEVEILRLKLEAEAKKDELNYRIAQDEAYRKERREREEQMRKDRERREAENKKFTRRFLIGSAVLAGLGVGAYGYYCYTTSRDPGRSRLALSAPKAVTTIDAEGSVK